MPREEENRRIAFFMHANQLFIQYIEKTRERGEKEREYESAAAAAEKAGEGADEEEPGGRRECNSKRE